ncbi:methyltransferase domain-containing protein [Sphingomonas morindae]|uniref:Methyltransferase domain-containing protein n=1 Tax=Sphingomonas morindae TaxID=1541170 RepID=A0ABY4X6Y2_9SPHN|nr:methyltransferase domain-containing protein [Sphingomonas morindae]USI72365.1 methyltransferase domain-containing protein [Sphingomonas morindae]
MNDLVAGGAAIAQGLELDPFGFVPSYASRIIGLGGHEASQEPAYAFHTPYIYCSPGEVTFRFKFSGLHASLGNLTIRINGIAPTSGGVARTIKLTAKPLRDLAHLDGEMSISIKAKSGVLYAAVGLIHGVTDAAAERLTVTIDRPSDGREFDEELELARKTVFGQTAAREVAHLISPLPATIADPVSQMCTASQFDEPTYDFWVEAMRAPKTRHRKQWEFVYILQALERYGVLQPGARGLGFGVGEEPIPAVLASRGCELVATDLSEEDERAAGWRGTGQHAASLEKLLRPDICPNELVLERVSHRAVDMNQIPADLRDFDFCWSSCALEHLGSIDHGLRFIHNSLQTLKIGGVAVHTTELNLSSNSDTLEEGGTVLFRRKDFERLCLDLVSLGHEVAQIKFDQGEQPLDRHVDMPPYRHDEHLKLALSNYVTTSFGVIIRRGSSAF